jgi:Cyclic nucleotide-binding domain
LQSFRQTLRHRTAPCWTVRPVQGVAADECAGPVEEPEQDVRAPLVADLQPPVVDQPRQRPLHWVYDHAGRLVAKSGYIDHDTWWREAFGSHTPWGAEDSAPIVTAVESALERQLSVAVIDAKPRFLRLQAGRTLVEQGQHGDEVFLLFDGVLRVEIDGKPVTEVGPGAIVGEMALLQEGRRLATLRAVTPCRVAVVPKDRIDRQALQEVAKSRMPRPER